MYFCFINTRIAIDFQHKPKLMKRLNFLTIALSIFILCAAMVAPSYAQLSKGGTPLSLQYELKNPNVPVFNVEAPSLENVEVEDFENEKMGMPYRVAFNQPVNIDFFKQASNQIIGENQVWTLEIQSAGAKALNLYFDNFQLPESGSFFVYSPVYDHIAGAFTSENNRPSNLFATQMIPGERMILEYSEPASNGNTQAVIRISDVGYHYRGTSALLGEKIDESDFCQVNINCPEGDDWQREKRGVTKLLMKEGSSSYLCSGSLINNTAQDYTPYLLTAYHCSGSASASDKEMWVFYFNYERAGCENTGTAPTNQTLTGCTMISRGFMSGGSDFQLLLLNNPPPDTYNPYWNGWDRGTSGSPSGVSIHHPSGDIKKISTYVSTLTTANWSGGMPGGYWRVYWAATVTHHGVTEGGSSGSPIFNPSKRIVGTLTGGGSYCNTPNSPDYYGKFDKHWDANGTSAIQRLAPWLDPCNLGVTELDGLGLEKLALAPDSVMAIPLGNGTLKLSWKKRNETDEVIIAQSNAEIFANPVNGTSYNAGSALNCNGQVNATVIYVGGDESVILSGLQPNTEYFFRIWSKNASNNYSVSRAAKATTGCNQVLEAPYTLTFSSSISDCWMLANNGGSPNNHWTFGSTSTGSISGYPAPYAFIDSYMYGSSAKQNADLISPIFNLSEYAKVYVSFAHRYRHRNNSVGSFDYSTDLGLTWNNIQSWTAHSANPDLVELEVTEQVALQPTVMFRFNYTGSDGWYWIVANFNLTGSKVNINDMEAGKAFHIYPNPAKGMIQIASTIDSDKANVEILNTAGQVLKAENVHFVSGKTSVSLNGVPKGLYLVRISTEKQTITKRLVVE